MSGEMQMREALASVGLLDEVLAQSEQLGTSVVEYLRKVLLLAQPSKVAKEPRGDDREIGDLQGRSREECVRLMSSLISDDIEEIENELRETRQAAGFIWPDDPDAQRLLIDEARMFEMKEQLRG